WMQQDITSSDGTFVDESGGQDLAGSSKDFTGAIAIMNVGSWLSFAKTVNTHSAGSNTFTYDLIGSRYHDKIANGSAFLEAAYACLSTNKEWYYNSSTGELFLIANDGLNPTGRDIRGKTITYALEILNSQNITVSGIDFFACTAKVTNSSKIAIENCDAMFPSYSKRMLGSTAKAEPTTIDGTTNTLRNCTFSYADGTGVEFVGDGGLIENCLFYQIDYSCVGTLHDVMVNVRGTSNLIFRNNTLDTGGNSVGIKGGPNGLFEYNIVTNQGMLQHDGSAIQADADYADGTIMQNNWIHDHIKFSLRFDSPWLDTTVYGTNGIMRNNVIWNTRPMVPKGDYHHIYGNTGFDNDIVDISIFADVTHGGWNTNTTTRNNAVNVISGERSSVDPYPGTSDHNWVGVEFDPDRDVKTQLNDPDQLDFRPAAGSDLIDAGLDVPAHVTSFVGTA
ncbi:MAG: right-handed parallel beta-helix repeat-containing protein, partial [Planctomycetes bacterium]|nr:right-handed parallel beta-helix repeat-containing protein [Planctomycetota bacterium]